MKLFRHLYFQVILGIVLGIIAGLNFPGIREEAKVLSDLFINLIRMVIAPVIFFTVVLGIAGAGEMKRVGRIGGKALIYFEVVTTLALFIGLVVANLVRPGAGVTPVSGAAPKVEKSFEWHEFITHLVPKNIVEAFAQGDIIQILVFAILFSVGLKMLGEKGKGITQTFTNLNQVLFNMLKLIIRLSPIGAFGGMAYTMATFGAGSLKSLALLMISFYATALLFIFVVLNLIARLYGFSLWKLLRYIGNEILIVLGSSSSETVLPNLMQKLEHAGCERSVVGLIIPTGYSFNLDGTTIYLSMAVIFIAQAYNIDLSLAQQLTIMGILIVTSKGAAGVTGSGFVVLASTLTATKVLPIEGLGMLVGVDRFMSEARAITNMIGNTVATVVIARSEHAVDKKRYKEVVGG